MAVAEPPEPIDAEITEMNDQVKELLLQSLEHERGGVKIYRAALQCAENAGLREQWEKYLEQTERHVQILTEVCTATGLDPKEKTPGSAIVHELGAALAAAIDKAHRSGNPEAAQIVASECVVLAETKDHLDWELIGTLADKFKGKEMQALKDAHDEVEEQEDEHLYHTRGWCRELWLKSLGLKAVLPPPEERKHVKTAISAARAEQARDQMR